MSIETVAVKKVRCDIKIAEECSPPFEAVPGRDAAQARADARDNGWTRARNPVGKGAADCCPACTKKLGARWGS